MRERLNAYIEVPVFGWTLVLGWVGVALGYAGIFSGHALLYATGFGLLCGFPLYVSAKWFARWRFKRHYRNMPVKIVVMPGSDGERVGFVTKLDGGVVSVVIPDDYDPSDDGGEWLVRQVAPELLDD